MNGLELLNEINSWVWGAPLLALLMGTGIYLTLRLNLLQVLKLPLAFKLIFSAKNSGSGDVNCFSALCMALAATIGTGNIVGVATAIKAGGPGALFWMWLAAFFGMATKYSEGVLAVKYRQLDQNGQIAGGPMYYIEKGMGRKYRPLAVLFSFSCILVSLVGTGTFPQINAIVSSVNISFGVPIEYTAAVLTILVAVIILGGIDSISRVSSKIVPFMALLYMVVCGSVIVINMDKIPAAISLVLSNAFTGTAATGGFLGASVMLALRSGVARGVFSNESGLGSAPIVSAAARTHWPAEQGLVSMTGTFIDTIIICTMTGITLIVTGVWCGDTAGSAMTSAALSGTYGAFGAQMLAVSLALFAFTSILGWNYYGERACVYLFGEGKIKWYRYLFILATASAAFIKLEAVWVIADIFNGIMALPNLLALLALSGVVVRETRAYAEHLRQQQER